jgi:hypothetical protein
MQAKEGFLKLGGFSGIYKGIGAVFLGSIPGGLVLSLQSVFAFTHILFPVWVPWLTRSLVLCNIRYN